MAPRQVFQVHVVFSNSLPTGHVIQELRKKILGIIPPRFLSISEISIAGKMWFSLDCSNCVRGKSWTSESVI